jgi:hypothetical protein
VLDAQRAQSDNRSVIVSTRSIWAAYAFVAAAMLVTYSHVAPHELYHVSGHGLAGGLSRVLVYSNFPVALVAAPLALLAARRLGTTAAHATAVAAVVLCAVVVVPGVVDEADLDARWINVIPAAGVALALALDLRAPRARIVLDRATLVACVVLVVASATWIAAELGFHAGFGVFLAGSEWHGHPAVHLGHHHGLDGTMLAATGLVLLRLPPALAGRAYAALMTAYGLVNAAQDAWTEQVVKRGWSAHEIPNALHPAANGAWLAIVVVAALVLGVVEARRSEGRTPVAAR